MHRPITRRTSLVDGRPGELGCFFPAQGTVVVSLGRLDRGWSMRPHSFMAFPPSGILQACSQGAPAISARWGCRPWDHPGAPWHPFGVSWSSGVARRSQSPLTHHQGERGERAHRCRCADGRGTRPHQAFAPRATVCHGGGGGPAPQPRADPGDLASVSTAKSASCASFAMTPSATGFRSRHHHSMNITDSHGFSGKISSH
jgi:hypothetical protein